MLLCPQENYITLNVMRKEVAMKKDEFLPEGYAVNESSELVQVKGEKKQLVASCIPMAEQRRFLWK